MRASPNTAFLRLLQVLSNALSGAFPPYASRSSRTPSASARRVRSSVSAVTAKLITWCFSSTSAMIGFSTLSAKF
jgi:hypothetical protein